jgi:hypothetical protein
MKRKTKTGIGLFITLLLISSTLTVAAIGKNYNTTQTTKHDKEPTDIGEIEFIKTIWDPINEIWIKHREIRIGDILRYNISLRYYGNGILHNIKITDTLPAEEISYTIDLDNITFINAPEIKTEIVGNMLCGECISYFDVMEYTISVVS